MQVIAPMGLYTWNNGSDFYSPDQLVTNFERINFHDHTPGRGVLVPFGGLSSDVQAILDLAVDAFQSGPTLPPAGNLGRTFYDTSNDIWYFDNGVEWVNIDTGSALEILTTDNSVLVDGVSYIAEPGVTEVILPTVVTGQGIQIFNNTMSPIIIRTQDFGYRILMADINRYAVYPTTAPGDYSFEVWLRPLSSMSLVGDGLSWFAFAITNVEEVIMAHTVTSAGVALTAGQTYILNAAGPAYTLPIHLTDPGAQVPGATIKLINMTGAGLIIDSNRRGLINKPDTLGSLLVEHVTMGPCGSATFVSDGTYWNILHWTPASTGWVDLVPVELDPGQGIVNSLGEELAIGAASLTNDVLVNLRGVLYSSGSVSIPPATVIATVPNHGGLPMYPNLPGPSDTVQIFVCVARISGTYTSTLVEIFGAAHGVRPAGGIQLPLVTLAPGDFVLLDGISYSTL